MSDFKCIVDGIIQGQANQVGVIDVTDHRPMFSDLVGRLNRREIA
ncbi:hypothetical protein [Ferrimonas lipolytica]|nr:hypothetical protein [Ferrimonas lipolytica]